MQEEKIFKYLVQLSKSIKVDYPNSVYYEEFIKGEGWGQPLYGYSWESRADRWYAQGDVKAFDLVTNTIVDSPNDVSKAIPIFPNLLRRLGMTETDLLPYSITLDNTTISGGSITCNGFVFDGNINNNIIIEESKMKQTLNKVLDTNKEAAKVAGKITAGKTANNFFLTKLAGNLPWYAKLFGKKKELVQNPLARLVTAELASTLTTHFGADNPKLKYISEAMVQEAMVELTANSQMLDKLIQELEGMVSLPDFKAGQ